MIDADLARRLVARQFPRVGGPSHHRGRPAGWDNRTFRLGTDLTVACPAGTGTRCRSRRSTAGYRYWLPSCRLPIPVPVARGGPGLGYPYPWSVYRWLEGVPAADATIADLTAFAVAAGGVPRRAPGGRIRPAARIRAAQLLPRRAADDLRRGDRAGRRRRWAMPLPAEPARMVWDAAVGRDLDRPPGVVPRRHRGRQPAGPRRPAGGGDRLRHLRRRRPGLRRGDRVDPVLGPSRAAFRATLQRTTRCGPADAAGRCGRP